MHTQAIALTRNQLFKRQITLFTLMTVSFYILFIFPAMATPMGDVLCEVVGMIYGNLGRGLATLAIIIVGVGATLGKVSWGLAITVAVGISVIFNASVILDLLTGVGTAC